MFRWMSDNTLNRIKDETCVINYRDSTNRR